MKNLIFIALTLTACGTPKTVVFAPVYNVEASPPPETQEADALPLPPSRNQDNRDAVAAESEASIEPPKSSEAYNPAEVVAIPVIPEEKEKIPTETVETPKDEETLTPTVTPVPEIVAVPEKIIKNVCKGKSGTIEAIAAVITRESGIREITVTVIFPRKTTIFAYTEVIGQSQYFVSVDPSVSAYRMFGGGSRWVGEMPTKLNGQYYIGILVSDPSVGLGSAHSVGVPVMLCDIKD